MFQICETEKRFYPNFTKWIDFQSFEVANRGGETQIEVTEK